MRELTAIVAFIMAIVGLFRLVGHLREQFGNTIASIADHSSRKKLAAWIAAADEPKLLELMQHFIKKRFQIRPYQIGSLPLIKKSIETQLTAADSLREIYESREVEAELVQVETIISSLYVQSEIINRKGVISRIKGEATPEVGASFDLAERQKSIAVDLLQMAISA